MVYAKPHNILLTGWYEVRDVYSINVYMFLVGRIAYLVSYPHLTCINIEQELRWSLQD